MVLIKNHMENQTDALELIGQQRLLIERKANENTLKLLSRDGQLRLSITITADGPVLRFEGPSLTVESTGDLAVGARRIAIHGREEVAITSGGNASISIAGELHSEANAQSLTARLGSVKVKANDDVQLLGEEVLLNCERETPLPGWIPLSPKTEVMLPRADVDGDPSLLEAVPQE